MFHSIRLCSVKIGLLVAALLVATFFSARTYADELRPRCGAKFGLCGYVDSETGVEVIPAQFERAFEFSEGLAAVRIDGLFGYIDRSGSMVIKPEFDLAGPFYSGLAEVLVEDVTGAINKTGQYVVEPQFARSVPFTKDTLIVADGTWRPIHAAGYEKLEGLSYGPTGLDRYGVRLYHLQSGSVSTHKYRIKIFDEPNGGLIWAKLGNAGRYGLLSADGTWHVPPSFSGVGRLYNGLAIVRGRKPGAVVQSIGTGRDPSGVVDKDGKLVLPLEFSRLSHLHWTTDYLQTSQDGRKALIKRDGTLLGGRYFDDIAEPHAGVLPRVLENETWYSIRADGTLVPDENDGRLILNCPSGLSIRERQGKAEFSHQNLSDPIEPHFDLTGFYAKDCEQPISVRLNDRWAFVSQDGDVIPSPPLFERNFSFRDGFAAVFVDGRWGIIDESGDFIVPPKYTNLQPRGGFYKAETQWRSFWIDAHGNRVSEPPDRQNEVTISLVCNAGVKLFAEAGKWGVVDADGEIVIAPEYDAITCFRNGVAWAANLHGTSWCPVGPDGQTRSKPKCRETHYPYYQSNHSPEKFSKDPFKSSVLWVRAALDYESGKKRNPPRWVSHRSGNFLR